MQHSQVLSDGVWAAQQQPHAWRLMQGCCVQNTAMADSGTELTMLAILDSHMCSSTAKQHWDAEPM